MCMCNMCASRYVNVRMCDVCLWVCVRVYVRGVPVGFCVCMCDMCLWV